MVEEAKSYLTKEVHYTNPLPVKPPSMPLRKMPLVHMIRPYFLACWEKDPLFIQFANAVKNETQTGRVIFDMYEATRHVMAQVEAEQHLHYFAEYNMSKLVTAVVRLINRSRALIAHAGHTEAGDIAAAE
jgi:hypothetical protein